MQACIAERVPTRSTASFSSQVVSCHANVSHRADAGKDMVHVRSDMTGDCASEPRVCS